LQTVIVTVLAGSQEVHFCA